MIGFALATLLVMVAGYGLARCLAGSESLRFSEVIASSWVLGGGVVSLATWIFGFVLDGWLLRLAVAVLALCLFIAGQFVRSVRSERSSWRWWDWTLLAVVIAVIGFSCYWAPKFRLGWDSMMIWEAKAYLAWQNGGVIPSDIYSDADRIFIQPFYPLFWPYLQAWYFGWMGAPHQAAISFISIGFLVAACCAFTGLIQRLGGPRFLGLLGGAMLFAVPYLFSGLWGLFSGYADFPLAVIMLLATGFAIWWIQTDSITAFRLLSAMVAILPWVKREGLFLCAGVLAIPCAMLILMRRWRMIMALVAPVCVFLLFWIVFLRVYEVARDPTFAAVTKDSFGVALSRIVPVSGAMGEELIRLTHWSVLWPCFGMALISLLLQRKWLAAGVLTTSTAIPLLGSMVAYLMSTWTDYLHHVNLSLARLVLQLAPTAILGVLLAFPWKARVKPGLEPVAR